MPPDPDSPPSALLETIRRFWGYDRLRPLQEEAIAAAIEKRDSLVVLPTGGGKSLCYQVPPLMSERLDLVVSPLISLMKDQLDGLRACGYPAAAIHSGLSVEERRDAERFLASGQCRLAFVAPERVASPGFIAFLQRLGVGAFAIDEAHCISHWGHDFRPEYRQLARLREAFPQASFHAYTATATERVRDDIVEQLKLRRPAVLIGRFDRPNLTYRIVPRSDLRAQILEVLGRHAGEAAIIYCISRADTERIADFLKQRGLRAACYHAGMSSDDRRRAQDAFIREEIDVVVATVAFGMGIDRSDVRCVIHAAMPKSIEHYQQEAGRAGRDGLAAECVLFHSPADAMRWKSLQEKSSGESEDPEGGAEARRAAAELLEQMRRFATPGRCRHRALAEYFGQDYELPDCGACDVCLGECEALEDATVEAQKILSCIARVGQRFGMGHVIDVLRGAESDRILALRHHQLSTYGLLRETPKAHLARRIHELLDLELIARRGEEFPVLTLTERSAAVLRGERRIFLAPLRRRKKAREAAAGAATAADFDRALFDTLRALRTRLARERCVPSYIIFSDASLRDMAVRRPRSPAEFLAVHGVGERKLADFGAVFLEAIAAHQAN
jgi:ATP-dependent DNA helicase RecQ